MKTVRKIGTILCLLLTGWFLSPVLVGMLHIGMVYPAVGFLSVAAVLWFWETVKSFLLRHKAVLISCCVLVAVAVAVVLVPLGLMTHAAWQTPTSNATVIVMGCQVLENRPSVMLQDRCSAAVAYLKQHPDSNCVATGGLGEGATITEARAIYNYLVANGIEAHRIALEERSTNTCENMTFAANVIQQKGWNPHVAIVSDSFHQWRSAYFAQQNGLIPAAVNCTTRPTMIPGYWAREVIAVYKTLILGY